MSKVLAIDYGTKKIGLAIGDKEERLAVPYGIIENKGRDFVIQELKKVCQEEDVKEIVVGMPYQKIPPGPEASRAGGKDKSSKIKAIVENFVNLLQSKFDILIAIEDERMTSKLADKSKEEWGENVEQDAIAAAVILQSYLDRN